MLVHDGIVDDTANRRPRRDNNLWFALETGRRAQGEGCMLRLLPVLDYHYLAAPVVFSYVSMRFLCLSWTTTQACVLFFLPLPPLADELSIIFPIHYAENGNFRYRLHPAASLCNLAVKHALTATYTRTHTHPCRVRFLIYWPLPL